eukprot:TRINITY_DN285_c0_g1_i1.p1 TRINITY_DN285_c0_g1~~TRINITY_DN285_c0_g1_i1.p1  ORF type:complete len:604 (-),score=183.71 TRINITY_DN285_c0_g1_i1:271-2082(-)
MAASDKVYDVIVVGGGLSGLTCSWRLGSRYNKEVLLLEASEDDKYGGYAGGRTRSYPLKINGEDHWVSVGGTWLLFEDWLALQLSKEVGVMPIADRPAFLLNAPGWMIGTAPWLLVELWLIGRKMVYRNSTTWWSTKTARKYDKMTLEEWLQSRPLASENDKAAVREYFWAFENFPVKEPSLDVPVNISAAFAAYCLYNRLHNITRTGVVLPKLMRWELGTGNFVKGIKEHISNHTKGVMLYNQKVTNIDDSNPDIVTVTTAAGNHYKAKYVIVAGSPWEAGKIQYTPSLPSDAQAISNGILPINMISLQVLLAWDTPWWYNEKEGVETLPDYRQLNNMEFYAEVFEVTGHIGERDPSKRGPGMIRFLSDPRVNGVKEALASDKSHAEKALEIGKIAAQWWAQYFPEHLRDKVLNFKSADIFNFADLPAMPGTGYYYPTNLLSQNGSGLRAKHGKVYFAGTERAVWGVQWMEGAIHRGNEISAVVAKKFDGSISVAAELKHWETLAAEVVREVRNGPIFARIMEAIKHLFHPSTWFRAQPVAAAPAAEYEDPSLKNEIAPPSLYEAPAGNEYDKKIKEKLNKYRKEINEHFDQEKHNLMIACD